MDSGICVISSELHFPHLPLPLRDLFFRIGDLLKEVCEMIGRRSHCSDGPKAKKQQYLLHRTDFHHERARLSYGHTTRTFRKYTPLEEYGLKTRPYMIQVTSIQGGRESTGGEIEWQEQKCTEHTWLPKVTASQDFKFSPGTTCDIPAGHGTGWYHQQGAIHHKALSFKRQSTSGSEPTQ